MTQYSLHRHSFANTITDVTVYTTLSLALSSFLSPPQHLLFPSVLFHFPFVTFQLPPFLSRYYYFLFSLSFTTCTSLLSVPYSYLFLFLSPASTFLCCLNPLFPSVTAVLKVNVADWLG